MIETMSLMSGKGKAPDLGPLGCLLRDKSLRPVFQPIANMADGSIHAHEALIRGPLGALHNPDALLAAARKEGLLLQFELACVSAVLDGWSSSQEPGRLFFNLSASALVDVVHTRGVDSIVASIRRRNLAPRMLVVELTEHEHVADMEALAAVVREVHQAGVMLALDDFGDGRSSLRLWSEIKPDVVKIDKYFTDRVSSRAEKLQTLRALIQIAEIFGTALVAEGIETSEDLRAVRDLRITFGQGYLLGRPLPDPKQQIEPEAARVFADRRVAVLPELRSASSAGRLRELQIVAADPIDAAMDHDGLAIIFQDHPDWHAVAVVDGDIPIGLIDRRQFMERYARQYFKELFGRKSCLTFANLSPRLVERDHKLDELIGILTSTDQRYLTEGFIVTENGRYRGLGTGDQLVRSVTESRIEAARHANPLTFLPGNIPIGQHIERLLASGVDFVACYADLSNFKPFNDHYGYWRGDEMIVLTAGLCIAHCDPQRDFVGHVGGDDFVILFQSSDWQQRCEALIDEFCNRARALFDDDAKAVGGIQAEDRDGVLRFFDCTTLAIGAVRVRRGQFDRAEDVANAAALAKHDSKRAGGGLAVRDVLQSAEIPNSSALAGAPVAPASRLGTGS